MDGMRKVQEDTHEQRRNLTRSAYALKSKALEVKKEALIETTGHCGSVDAGKLKESHD